MAVSNVDWVGHDGVGDVEEQKLFGRLKRYRVNWTYGVQVGTKSCARTLPSSRTVHWESEGQCGKQSPCYRCQSGPIALWTLSGTPSEATSMSTHQPEAQSQKCVAGHDEDIAFTLCVALTSSGSISLEASKFD